MKKFVFVFTLFFVHQIASAQQFYTWEDYGIAFTLPDDFSEDVSTGEEFSATGDGMQLSIIPFSDETIDDSDITAYTMSIAADLELDRIDDISTININGFSGGYAEGELDGARLFVMGLIDPNTDTNFFVIITFLDYDDVAVDEAVRICRSFKRM